MRPYQRLVERLHRKCICIDSCAIYRCWKDALGPIFNGKIQRSSVVLISGQHFGGRDCHFSTKCSTGLSISDSWALMMLTAVHSFSLLFEWKEEMTPWRWFSGGLSHYDTSFDTHSATMTCEPSSQIWGYAMPVCMQNFILPLGTYDKSSNEIGLISLAKDMEVGIL